MDIVTAINQLGAEVTRIVPDLNSGGCCVFAAALAEQMTSVGVHDVSVVVVAPDFEFDDDMSSLTDARQKIRERKLNTFSKKSWNDVGVWFYHVGVRFRHSGALVCCDSSGVSHNPETILQYEHCTLYDGHLSVAEACAIANEDYGWSKLFDRCHIPHINKMVKYHINRHRISDPLPCYCLLYTSPSPRDS